MLSSGGVGGVRGGGGGWGGLLPSKWNVNRFTSAVEETQRFSAFCQFYCSLSLAAFPNSPSNLLPPLLPLVQGFTCCFLALKITKGWGINWVCVITTSLIGDSRVFFQLCPPTFSSLSSAAAAVSLPRLLTAAPLTIQDLPHVKSHPFKQNYNTSVEVLGHRLRTCFYCLLVLLLHVYFLLQFFQQKCVLWIDCIFLGGNVS